MIDSFLIGHPVWKIAFVEPKSRQVCVRDNIGVTCLPDLDYDYPGGFRRQLGSWSPDGTRFAWDRTDDKGIYIWTIGVGTEPFKVSGEGLVYRYPIWSPDGNYIAYHEETVAFSGLSPEIEGLYIEALDHSITYHISHQKSILDWSPSGKQVLYSENNSSPTEGTIIAANLDGTQQQTIFHHPGKVFRPRWSPDGLHIAYLADPDHYKMHLHVLNADGTADRDLGLFEYGSSPAFLNFSWLPDGNHILYADQSINVTTGLVTRLFFSFDPGSAIWFLK
jgi:Tol biopolymer transport system component